MKVFTKVRDTKTGERGEFVGYATNGDALMRVGKHTKRLPRERVVNLGAYQLIRFTVNRWMVP